METKKYLSCRELLRQYGYSCENPAQIECITSCPINSHCNLFKRFRPIIPNTEETEINN